MGLYTAIVQGPHTLLLILDTANPIQEVQPYSRDLSMDRIFITALKASRHEHITPVDPRIRATGKPFQAKLFAYWMTTLDDDKIDPRAIVDPGILDASAFSEWSVILLSRSVTEKPLNYLPTRATTFLLTTSIDLIL